MWRWTNEGPCDEFRLNFQLKYVNFYIFLIGWINTFENIIDFKIVKGINQLRGREIYNLLVKEYIPMKKFDPG